MTDRRFMPEKVRRPREEMVDAVTGLEATGLVVAGSYRREKETIGDLDCLVLPDWTIAQAESLMRDYFDYEPIRGGEMKSEGIATYHGKPLLINLWRVPTLKSYAAMLLFATGPHDLNIAMRARAKGRGWLLGQYGLMEGEVQLDGGRFEEDIFEKLDMFYLSPVEREHWRDYILRPAPKTTAVQVESSSGSGSYTVTIKEGKAVDCECPGFQYRGRCRHLKEAEAQFQRASK